MKKKIFIYLLILLCFILASCSSKKEQRQLEANTLKLQEVETWLEKNDIHVPVDLQKELNISQYVIEVIEKAEQGVDVSIAISYTKTKEFIAAIQKAAGYEFHR